MSGWLSRLFDPSVLPQDYSAPPNQLGPLAQQVMRNPVGTETTSPYASQSVGVPQGPFNPIEAMTSSGQPILGTDMDRARAAVAQGMQEAPAMVLGMVGDAPGGKGFTAYHGSPHSFDAFDLGKIGTGEGAQAYGHGLYFAENEGVARGYRDRLAGKIDLMAPLGKGTPENLGHMYEVNINAPPEHFLDWDKPLHEQSPHVQEALSKVLGTDVSQVPVSPFTGRPLTGPFNPGGAYENVVSHFGLRRDGADIQAAQALRDAGIPGIRYLDAGSRGGAEGTRNTVIFDPATIEILRKYGIAGLMAGGAGAIAGTRQPQQ